MDGADLKVLENYWKDYHYHKREIDLLENAYSKKQLQNDKRYSRLLEIVNTIDTVLSELKVEHKDFANLRYLSEDADLYDWADVADELGITKAKAYKVRQYILRKTADKLGFVTRPIKV